jgi:hypothetical protein
MSKTNENASVLSFSNGVPLKNRINSSRVEAKFSIDDLISGTGLDDIKDDQLLKEISNLPADYNGGKSFFAFVVINIDNGVKLNAMELQKQDGGMLQIVSTSCNFDDKEESFDLSLKFDDKASIKELGEILKLDENTSFVAKFTQYRAKSPLTRQPIEGEEGLRWSISYLKAKIAKRKASKCINGIAIDVVETPKANVEHTVKED